MGRRALKTDDEAGFLMAFCDDIRETEALYRVKIKCEILLGKERGTIMVRMVAWKAVDGGEAAPVAVWEGPYPTHATNRLHAGLYRAAIGIGAQCGRVGLPYKHEDSESTVD